MGQVTLTPELTPDTDANAEDVMALLELIVAQVNGNLDPSNFAKGGAGMGDGSFMAYLGTTYSPSDGGTVVFDQELWDYDSTYNAATGVWTCPSKGVYIVSAGLTGIKQNMDFSEFFRMAVARGDGEEMYNDYVAGNSGTADFLPIPKVSGPVLMNAGETLAVKRYYGGLGSPNVVQGRSYSYFSALLHHRVA